MLNGFFPYMILSPDNLKKMFPQIMYPLLFTSQLVFVFINRILKQCGRLNSRLSNDSDQTLAILVYSMYYVSRKF